MQSSRKNRIPLLTLGFLISFVFNGCDGLRKRSFKQISEDIITEIILEDIEQSGHLLPTDYSNYGTKITVLDYRPTYQQAWFKKALKLQTELVQLDGTELGHQELNFYLERIVSLDSNRLYQYPITPFFGPHLDSPKFLTSISLASQNQIEQYVELLQEFETQFGGLIDALEFQRKKGVILPTFLLNEIILQCDSITLQSATENILYAHCKNELDKIGIMEPVTKQTYLDEVQNEINQTVYPSYVRLANYLRQLERNSTSVAGLWQYENGKTCYQNFIKLNTGVNTSLDTLNMIGKLELNRLEGEISIVESLAQNLEASFKDTLSFSSSNLVKRVISSGQLELGYKLFFSKYSVNLSPEKHFHTLKNQQLVITALLVDLGIHHKRWLREQAIDFVLKHCNVTENEARSLVDKSISKPSHSAVAAVTFLRLCELYENGEIDLPFIYQKSVEQGCIPTNLLN